MKILLLLLSFTICLPSAWSAGGPSAQTSLRVVEKGAGVSIGPKLVSIMGVNGGDQPATWLYTIRNAQGQFFEFNVTNGRYVGSRMIAASPLGGIVASKRWKIDSAGAFAIVERLARKSKVGFDSVNYHLRCAELSDRPVWFLTLVNARSQAVGLVTLAADNGAVLSSSFTPLAPTPPAAPQPGQTQYYTPNQASSPPPVERPGIGDSLKQGAERVGNTFRGWIDRLRSPAPAPAPYNYGQPVR